MDGARVSAKRRFGLQFRLSLSLSLIVLVIGAVATMMSYSRAYEEVGRLQDEQMIQLANWSRSRIKEMARKEDFAIDEDEKRAENRLLSNPLADGQLTGLISNSSNPGTGAQADGTAGIGAGVFHEFDDVDDLRELSEAEVKEKFRNSYSKIGDAIKANDAKQSYSKGKDGNAQANGAASPSETSASKNASPNFQNGDSGESDGGSMGGWMDDSDASRKDSDGPSSGLVIQAIDSPKIQKIFGHPEARDILKSLPEKKIDTILINHRRWRVYVFPVEREKSRYVVAQLAKEREKISKDIAFSSVWSWFFIIPILWLLIGVVTNKTFKGIKRQAEILNRRHVNDISPFPTAEVDPEIREFVEATNGLLERLNQSFSSYRRFIADAAHELRTPVMALSLQSDSLADESMSPEERKKRVKSLKAGVKRLRDLLQQLLTLARVQGQISVSATEEMEVAPLLRTVIGEIYPMADAKDIDLGVSTNDPMKVKITEVALRAILKNLIENAVRYTPEGGRVDVHVISDGEGRRIVIEDTGRGIPEHLVPEVVKPFSRHANTQSEGSGLGLAIVNEICLQMGARMRFEPSTISEDEDFPGLKLTVLFDPEAGASRKARVV